MFKYGQDYKYNGKVIKAEDGGYICRFDYFEKGRRYDVVLFSLSVPQMIWLIDTY